VTAESRMRIATVAIAVGEFAVSIRWMRRCVIDETLSRQGLRGSLVETDSFGA